MSHPSICYLKKLNSFSISKNEKIADFSEFTGRD